MLLLEAVPVVPTGSWLPSRPRRQVDPERRWPARQNPEMVLL